MNTHNKVSPIKCYDRLGILGGTFDPIHRGHTSSAIQTANWLKLKEIYLLPAHIPPHKVSTGATAMQRKAMVELVCKQHPELKVDARELLRTTPSYTIDTLKEIKQQHPNSQVFFILGMDSILQFTQWHKWQEILEHCHIVVNARPQYQWFENSSSYNVALSSYFADNLEQLTYLEAGKVIFHQQQELDISSTEIRTEISNNIFDDKKLTASVIDYIKQQQLYKT